MVHADSEHPPRPLCGERSRFVSRSKPEGARVRRRVDVCKRGGLHARILRTCSRSPEQQCQERQVDELQAGIEPSLAVLP
ncbi:hypothetical protein BRL93_01015 [Xanthomonas oryzae pv. oryzae]|nr:hypothetical protein BRN32_09720 [Xanthomonas oryzae pv. oryzae]RBH95220.1 hypothetical protein BRL93_01015 [Xanthomonas oryzae pv. oryzae]RBJ39799.1 hypothetical protein BRN91_13935 [Xanthomonas oryzae pv. oryzae]RBL29434.1 hypothetical protein BRN31_12775 [Xanthomonas oryzae pv. oryzae]RBL46735.1 hypothetical protein BRN24_24040 [Xanthomonas oryzae pv. oryzae]